MFDIKHSISNQYFFHERFHHLIPGIEIKLKDQGIGNHLCLLSSGTTSQAPKGFALSLTAVFESALAVNRTLGLSSMDRWGLTLPPYHIGGLAILARSELLSRAPAYLLPWRPDELKEGITKEKVTAISLVPAQIYDLVQKGVSAPSTLKVVLAGGDFLSEALKKSAEDLGWPIIRTFGMTEVASSLAIGGDLKQGLKLLPLHEIKTDTSNQLWIKTRSLFSAKFSLKEDWEVVMTEKLLDQGGFYPSSDRVELTSQGIIPLGRNDGHFKSSGHLISLFEIKEALDAFLLRKRLWGRMEIFLRPDDRKGQILCLYHESNLGREALEFESSLSPLRFDVKQEVIVLPKTDLGKTRLPLSGPS